MANIFLLEDDKILSRGITIALEKDEHVVTAVYGYVEAVQKYPLLQYDACLLDINLPDGSGLTFVKKFESSQKYQYCF